MMGNTISNLCEAVKDEGMKCGEVDSIEQCLKEQDDSCKEVKHDSSSPPL